MNASFILPEPSRDALFAHSWFTRPEGEATLLSMGNAKHEIVPSTLEGEAEIMQEFLDLEAKDEQITRVIRVNDVTVGVVWIELVENHGVQPPSIHLMIGNPDYRGKGLGRAAMEWAVLYIKEKLMLPDIYSRHLASNTAISALNASLGFEKDGVAYVDENGLEWQNVKYRVKES